MSEEYDLRYGILFFVSNMKQSHRDDQIEYFVLNQETDKENYQPLFDKSFNYLKDNGFMNVKEKNNGDNVVSSLTEKGETVLKFSSWEEYLNKEKINKTTLITNDDRIFNINENRELLLEKLIENKSNNQYFIDPKRLSELRNIKNSDFDLSKLIKFCEELNFTFLFENYLSVGMLMRAIIDHIPPIFGYSKFNEVTNNYGSKSFKKSMEHLNKSLRNISDSYLHTHIRKKETLPNKTQINFSSDMDVLLSEIVRKLS